MDDLKQKLAQDENIIYHYTNAIAALCYILPDYKLRFSQYCNTNDPFEYSYLDLPGLGFVSISNEVQEKYNEQSAKIYTYRSTHCKFISFCLSTKDVPGFMKPRMWSQYGDNQKGVCLAFRKDKLIENCGKVSDKILSENVSYGSLEKLKRLHIRFDDDRGSDVYAEDFLRKHKSELLFSKHMDYKDENEYRIILVERDANTFVNIRDSLVAIIAGDRFYDGLIPSAFYFAEQYDIDLRRVYWNDGQYELLYLGPKERYGNPIMEPMDEMFKRT